jgi:hypothetical protein
MMLLPKEPFLWVTILRRYQYQVQNLMEIMSFYLCQKITSKKIMSLCTNGKRRILIVRRNDGEGRANIGDEGTDQNPVGDGRNAKGMIAVVVIMRVAAMIPSQGVLMQATRAIVEIESAKNTAKKYRRVKDVPTQADEAKLSNPVQMELRVFYCTT